MLAIETVRDIENTDVFINNVNITWLTIILPLCQQFCNAEYAGTQKERDRREG